MEPVNPLPRSNSLTWREKQVLVQHHLRVARFARRHSLFADTNLVIQVVQYEQPERNERIWSSTYRHIPQNMYVLPMFQQTARGMVQRSFSSSTN